MEKEGQNGSSGNRSTGTGLQIGKVILIDSRNNISNLCPEECMLGAHKILCRTLDPPRTLVVNSRLRMTLNNYKKGFFLFLSSFFTNEIELLTEIVNQMRTLAQFYG